MADSKITTRLRPDVDRRLRAAAALQRMRISRLINDALDASLPSLRELSVMVARKSPVPGEDSTDDDRR